MAVELENAVESSDQTLAPADGTGEVDTQLAMAMAIYGAGGAQYMIDTGAADAYVLDPVSPKESAPAYFDGLTVTFRPVNANTTASTVNVNSLGVKDLVDSYGDALIGGELDTNNYYTIIYNLSADEFRLASNLFKITNVLGGRKNLMDNGNCEIYQYATSQSADGYLSKDRYEFINITSASQQSITGITSLRYADQWGNTGTSTPTVSHKILAVNAERLVGKRLTYSVWLKSISGTSGVDVDFYYPTSTNNDFAVVTNFDSFTPWGDGAAVTTFTRYSYTFTVPTGCAKGLMIEISRTSTASNAFTQATGHQLEENPYPTDFEYKNFENTLLDCLPYFEKSYNYSVSVGSGSNPGAIFNNKNFTSNVVIEQKPIFRLRKIVVPSITAYSPNSGTADRVYNFSTVSDISVTAYATVSETTVQQITLGSSINVDEIFQYHWIASTGF